MRWCETKAPLNFRQISIIIISTTIHIPLVGKGEKTMKRRRTGPQVDALVEEIVEMVQAGAPPTAIAEELGLSKVYVYDLMNRAGVKPIAVKGSWIAELGDEVVAEIVNAYTKGEVVRTILDKYELSYTKMYTILRHMGIEAREVIDQKQQSRRERLDAAVNLYEEGAPIHLITADTGIGQPQLHNELRARKVTLRREGRRYVRKSAMQWKADQEPDPEPLSE